MKFPDIQAILFAAVVLSVTATAQDHEGHGEWIPASERELFYRSPFHKAEIRAGLAEVSVTITTASRQAQAFFNQGMSMLYAGWTQEAERSFHTAHLLDEEAPMPRWGVALTHLMRDSKLAVPWLSGLEDRQHEGLRDIESILLKALPPNRSVSDTNSTWRIGFVKQMRLAIRNQPNATELKAILACLLSDTWHPWLEEVGESRDGVLALVADVLKADPKHPAARLGLRLWSHELRHDPYHTKKKYFDLRHVEFSSAYPAHWNLVSRHLAERERFSQALQYSEMASRIHHHWASLHRRMPDLLPEYARHRAIQGEQLRTAGNAEAAIAIAHDLLRLPCHPKWNAATNSFGSHYAGRKLLLETYRFYGLWDELTQALRSGLIEELDSPVSRAEYAYAEAVSAYFRKDQNTFAQAASRLKSVADSVRADFIGQRLGKKDAPEDPHHDSMLQWLREGGEDYLAVTEWNRSVIALQRHQDGDNSETADLLAGSRRVPSLLRARLLWSTGHKQEARQALLNTVELPLSLRVKLTQASQKDADEFPLPPLKNHGSLPRIHQLDALKRSGLTRWEPPMFPQLSIPLLDGATLDNRSLRGRHTALIFVYSSTCSHCVDQLDLVRKSRELFKSADLDVRVIAGQSAQSLADWLKKQDAFPAVFGADPYEKHFRTIGAYDDFNDMPLHATIYIDPEGRMLWKDVGYEPFMEIEFFVKETLRLRRHYPATHSE